MPAVTQFKRLTEVFEEHGSPVNRSKLTAETRSTRSLENIFAVRESCAQMLATSIVHYSQELGNSQSFFFTQNFA